MDTLKSKVKNLLMVISRFINRLLENAGVRIVSKIASRFLAEIGVMIVRKGIVLLIS